MKRLLRRLSTTGNSNLPIALSEVFLVFVGLLIQIAHRAWVNCPYGANSNGHISPSQDISPTPIFRKENLTRFALTGLELARPADWRQNMTNHKTQPLILGLFFKRGDHRTLFISSHCDPWTNLETLGTFVQSITRPRFQPGTSTSSSSSHKSWRQRRGEATTRRHLDAQHVSECTVRVSECKP